MQHSTSPNMRITIGNPAEGDNFYGREKELKQLWDNTETNHLLMLAPRRIGKTSLLKKMRDSTSSQDARVYYCSFADCKTENDCIEKLYKTLELSGWKKHLNDLSNNLKKLKKVGPDGIEMEREDKPEWEHKARHFHKQLDNLQTKNKRIIICVDELPIFVLALIQESNGKEKTRYFLNWFRSVRQDYHHKIKWILAGSVGLDTITSRHNMGDTINDLAPFPLGAYEPETATTFLQDLLHAYQKSIPEEVCQYLLTKVGWSIPFYLQLISDQLKNISTSPLITPEDVDSAFLELLKPAQRTHFDYWHQRLREQLGQADANHAILLLNHISKAPNGVSRMTLKQALEAKTGKTADSDSHFMYLLDVLESDGYIVEQQQRYQFRLSLLRDYWHKRYAHD